MQDFINKLPYMTKVVATYKGVIVNGFISKHLYGNKTITIQQNGKLVKLYNMQYVTSIDKVQ